MLREILQFEFRYQIRQPIFAIAVVIFFILTFGAVTTDSVQIGGSIGNVNRNAPFVIMQLLLTMSIMGVFFATAFVSGAIHRDFEYGTDSIFFSMPIRKGPFLFGRFLGSLAVACLVFAGVVGAIVVGSFMPWLEPERIGPFALWPYLYTLSVFVLPNLFLMGSMFFSLATLTRSLMYTYTGLVVFFVAYGVGSSLLVDLDNEFLGVLLDPFGFGALAVGTKYWTTAERNSIVLPVEGALLYNRLLWLGVGAAILAFTHWRFRFTTAGGGRASRRARRLTAPAPAGAAVGARAPVVTPRFTAATRWTQFLRQAGLEVSGTLKSIPFIIILFLGVLNVVGGSFFLDQMYGTPVLPVTHLLLDLIQGSFLLFVVIILTFYSGEIVWRERSLRLSELYDALPIPNWVLWGSKMTALAAVLVLLLGAALLTGMGIQLFRGYHGFELPLYLRGLFLEIGVPFLIIAVLALFLQVAANHKYLGFLLMVLYFISLPVMVALHYDHNLYRYAGTPSAPYSDMNGYGHFVAPLFWYCLYWTFGAVILLVLSHLLWVRGTVTGLRERLTLARQRLTRPAALALFGAAAAFIATGGFIFYNTNVLNPYIPGDLQETRQAALETKYKPFESAPNPRITAVRADVDIYPERRAVDIRGRYVVRNKTAAPLDAIHVTLDPRVTRRALEVPGARLETDDPELGYYIYRLDEPMAPGAEMAITFDLGVAGRGFVNNGANTKLVYNGTFFSNFDYFPHLGYTREAELQDPNDRRKHGLPPIQRFPKIDDEAARQYSMLSREADWVDFETTVSTSPDQIAIAPGYLEGEWTKNGRRYFHYKMDAPILNIYSYQSARYEVKRDRWNDVAIEIYYHPAHPYNVDRMIDATKKSLDYFTAEFGPYQHRQVRIVEFPRYARFAESDPNTIPFSESIGFIARLDDEDDIDYVFYVTAHEVAHQWWAHQVIGGFVQGATMLSESLSQYSALMVMEREYGREKMRKFLKYELDSYLRGRGGERIEEVPLYLVEAQPYIHYRKGSLSMYALRDAAGEKPLNAALARFVRDVRFQEPPYTTTLEFLDYVAKAVPAERNGILDDLFRTITVYDNRVTGATYEQRPDGKYAVRLTVESRKYRADGQGEETEVVVGDWIDVGVFGEKAPGGVPEGRVLALEKRRIDSPEAVLEIVVDEKPLKAGIDPFHKLIDRNPKNNLVPATLAAAS